MAERRPSRVLTGLKDQAAMMPTAMDRLGTMISLVHHLNDQGMGPNWRRNSEASLGRLARGIILSPAEQIKDVGIALRGLMVSSDKKEIALGRTIAREFIKARQALGL